MTLTESGGYLIVRCPLCETAFSLRENQADVRDRLCNMLAAHLEVCPLTAPAISQASRPGGRA